MAGRGGERFEKRLRERARQEKAAAKRERRADRKTAEEEGDEAEKPSEDELLEAVRVLNEQRAAGSIDEEDFEERRTELFEQLGLA